ncbi:MAG: YadA-like family protein [Eikenella sp.]|nr:YadA-like family protein [Eikenella sp.]
MTRPFRPAQTAALILSVFGVLSGTAYADTTERLNRLEAQHQTLSDRFNQIQQTAKQNTDALAALALSSGEQQNDLLAQDRELKKQQADIGRHNQEIADNTQAILSNFNRIQANQTQIGETRATLERQARDIADTQAALQRISLGNGVDPEKIAQIEQNTQNIDNQRQRIDANVANLNAQAGLIGSNRQGITANQKALQQQSGRLDAAQQTIDQHGQTLREQAGTLKTHQEQLTALQQQSGRLDAAQNTLDQHSQTLQEQAGALKTHQAQLAAQQAQNERNRDAIAVQDTVIRRHQAEINANRDLINQHLNQQGLRTAEAEAQIARNSAGLQQLSGEVRNLKQETERGFAAQAALSGLFQPYGVGKFNLTAAVGGYRKQSAVAVGAGYRFNEQFATKAGVAFSPRGGAAVYHVGVNLEW